MVRHTEKMEEVMDKVYSSSKGHISCAAYGENRGGNGHWTRFTVQVKAILVVLHTEKMEELMDKVYSASIGHICDAAYREKMEELMGKVYSASTGHISGTAYGEN